MTSHFAMGGVENAVTFDHRLYTEAYSKSFGGGRCNVELG